MTTVTSRDGTSIAYLREGDGPPVVLVGGGLDDGSENAALVPELAQRFTVFNYARRGRAESGDTAPYSVQREIEDIDALIAVAGGPVHLFGASSGGALAIEATAAGLAVDRLAVYEVPYQTDEMLGPWADYVTRLTELLAENRPADALELFMRLAGSPDEVIAEARQSPFWASGVTLAPTLAYDAACLGDGRVPVGKLAKLTQPTLVATGGTIDPQMSGLQPGFFDAVADAMAAALPQAERQVLKGQGHAADPQVLGSALRRFFNG